ncbi:MAG: FeoA family protein [Promethearchaeota archaeon]
MINKKKMKLSELKPGDTGKIVDITGEKKYIRRLSDMGLIRGTSVKMIRRAPLGDPIEIIIRGYKLTLRKHEIEGIIVEKN